MTRKNSLHRILWIDNLKGFILVLVVISHMELYIFDWLKPARMTTFFFLSGYLFQPRDRYIKHKIRYLLYPYISLSLLFSLIFPKIPKTHFTDGFIGSLQYLMSSHNIPENVMHYISNLFGNIISCCQGKPECGITPMWFVYTLFQVSCLFFFTYGISRLDNRYKLQKFIILMFSCICLVIGWACNKSNTFLPFQLHTMFTASFFFGIGNLCKLHIDHITQKFSHIQLLFFIFTSFMIYILTNYTTIDIYINELGTSLPRFLIKTISGILFLITSFALLSKIISDPILGILRNISKNGIIVLFSHYYIIFLINIFWRTSEFSLTCLIFVPLGTLIAIPLFRNKLYWLIGRNKISIKESLSIK